MDDWQLQEHICSWTINIYKNPPHFLIMIDVKDLTASPDHFFCSSECQEHSPVFISTQVALGPWSNHQEMCRCWTVCYKNSSCSWTLLIDVEDISLFLQTSSLVPMSVRNITHHLYPIPIECIHVDSPRTGWKVKVVGPSVLVTLFYPRHQDVCIGITSSVTWTKVKLLSTRWRRDVKKALYVENKWRWRPPTSVQGWVFSLM